MEIADVSWRQKEKIIIIDEFRSQLQIFKLISWSSSTKISIIKDKIHAKPIVDKRPKARVLKIKIVNVEYYSNSISWS